MGWLPHPEDMDVKTEGTLFPAYLRHLFDEIVDTLKESHSINSRVLLYFLFHSGDNLTGKAVCCTTYSPQLFLNDISNC